MGLMLPIFRRAKVDNNGLWVRAICLIIHDFRVRATGTISRSSQQGFNGLGVLTALPLCLLTVADTPTTSPRRPPIYMMTVHLYRS